MTRKLSVLPLKPSYQVGILVSFSRLIEATQGGGICLNRSTALEARLLQLTVP